MSENITDKLVGDLEDAYGEIARLKDEKDYLKRSFRPTRNSLQTLSKEFEIPLRIGGIAIEEGEWNGVYWPSKELEKNAEELEGMAITVDHPVDEKDGSLGVMDEVGKITAANWNASDSAIEFEGEIVDEAVARRVFHDTVDAVSVGADVDKSEKNGRMEVQDIISWLELSLVQSPAVPDARIEVLEAQESDQIQSDEQEVNPLSEKENKEAQEAQETEEEEKEPTEGEEPLTKEDLENLEVEEDLQGYKPYGKYPYSGGYYYPNLDEKIGELFKRIKKIEEESQEAEEEESESEETESEESEEESTDELREEIDTLKEVVETLKDEPVKLSKETTEESNDENFEEGTLEWLKKRES